jgi:hypothetical protein
MKINVEKLNRDIEKFPQVHPITNDMYITYDGIRRILKLPADFEFKSDDASDAAAIGLAFAIESGLIKGVGAE